MPQVVLLEVSQNYDNNRDDYVYKLIRETDWQFIDDKDYKFLQDNWIGYRGNSKNFSTRHQGFNVIICKRENVSIVISELKEELKDILNARAEEKLKADKERQQKIEKQRARLAAKKDEKIHSLMKKYSVAYSQAEELLKDMKIRS